MRLNVRAAVQFSLLSFMFCLLAPAVRAAEAREMKFEARLIWATNADKSPNPEHKAADADLQKLLGDLPLKWKNYFVVTNVPMTVTRHGATKVTLSDQCQVEVKDIDGETIEVALIGKGEPVLRRTQPLPKRKALVVGGKAPADNGWLVVLKRVD